MTTNPRRVRPLLDGKPMKCCAKHNIANMDHRSGMIEADTDQPWMINRVCLSCGKHWYGQVGQVRAFTKPEWNRFLDDRLVETTARGQAAEA